MKKNHSGGVFKRQIVPDWWTDGPVQENDLSQSSFVITRGVTKVQGSDQSVIFWLECKVYNIRKLPREFARKGIEADSWVCIEYGVSLVANADFEE